MTDHKVQISNQIHSIPRIERTEKRKKRRPSPAQISDKDLAILHFIWRWKVASTSLVYHRYLLANKWKPKTCVWRISVLRKKGFVKYILCSCATEIFWCLTPKGFDVVKAMLPPLSEDGYLSEVPHHDFQVACAQLGDWCPKDITDKVAFVTEQELRRIDKEFLPKWLPSNPRHRPDGYWNFLKDGKRVVAALEVELTSKRSSDYLECAYFYDQTQEIDRVIWIVRSLGLSNLILQKFEESHRGKRKIHNFIHMEDFKEQGWGAKIFAGPEKDFSIRQFFGIESSINGQVTTHNLPLCVGTKDLFDTRVSAFKTATYPNASEGLTA